MQRMVVIQSRHTGQLAVVIILFLQQGVNLCRYGRELPNVRWRTELDLSLFETKLSGSVPENYALSCRYEQRRPRLANRGTPSESEQPFSPEELLGGILGCELAPCRYGKELPNVRQRTYSSRSGSPIP